MSENRYENMTKEEILNLAKKGITINNEEERKTFYNCIGPVSYTHLTLPTIA